MKKTSILLLSLFVFGCNQETKEETKTVQFYKENLPERQFKLKECKDNPGELMETPNCINALAADKSSAIGGYKEFKPKQKEQG